MIIRKKTAKTKYQVGGGGWGALCYWQCHLRGNEAKKENCSETKIREKEKKKDKKDDNKGKKKKKQQEQNANSGGGVLRPPSQFESYSLSASYKSNAFQRSISSMYAATHAYKERKLWISLRAGLPSETTSQRQSSARRHTEKTFTSF